MLLRLNPSREVWRGKCQNSWSLCLYWLHCCMKKNSISKQINPNQYWQVDQRYPLRLPCPTPLGHHVPTLSVTTQQLDRTATHYLAISCSGSGWRPVAACAATSWIHSLAKWPWRPSWRNQLIKELIWIPICVYLLGLFLPKMDSLKYFFTTHY